MSSFVMTGHKGLIGSALLEKLKDRGDNPVLLADLRAKIGIDIRDLSHIIMDEPIDVLYHLASFCKINESIKFPSMAFENNVQGTFEVMQFCRTNHIPKIVFTSSTRVVYPEKNPYTASKIYGEEIVKSHEMEYVIIRPSTVYGPHWDETRRLIHIWVLAALRDQELKIFGNESKTLDFTYVDDFVDAFLEASQHTNQEFNVGSGQAVLLNYVAEYIISRAGGGYLGYYPAEKLQPQNVVVDTDFPCDTSIEDGLDKTIEFYRRQMNGN